MIDPRTAAYAALGVLFPAHAVLKASVLTPAGTAASFERLGLPGALPYLTLLAETLGGLAVVPILLGAILTTRGPAGFLFDDDVGGRESPAFEIVGLVTIAPLGDGAYAVRPAPRRT